MNCRFKTDICLSYSVGFYEAKDQGVVTKSLNEYPALRSCYITLNHFEKKKKSSMNQMYLKKIKEKCKKERKKIKEERKKKRKMYLKVSAALLC